MEALTFTLLVAACAPHVDIATAHALVATESSFNAHAIGVVAGRLERQPRSRGEAMSTAMRLKKDRWDYSVGLAQINVRNFERLGLTIESAFDPCTNLSAMQAVLTNCYDRAARAGSSPQRALREALSCYYSGNPRTGFNHGYVQRVVRAAAATPTPTPPKEVP